MSDYTKIPPVQIGDKAPLFTLKNQKGQKVYLKDYLGKQNVLLIFYPGDDTPGCTKQLCDIRNDFSNFEKINIKVFGINQADKNSHQNFINKYALPFDLLIDNDYKVSSKYKAMKFMFGRPSIKRSVVLIDKAGQILFLKRGMPSNKEILKSLN